MIEREIVMPSPSFDCLQRKLEDDLRRIRNAKARAQRLAQFEREKAELVEACNRFFLFEDDVIKML